MEDKNPFDVLFEQQRQAAPNPYDALFTQKARLNDIETRANQLRLSLARFVGWLIGRFV